MGFGIYKAEKAILPSIEKKGDYKVTEWLFRRIQICVINPVSCYS